ncbi:MAG: LPS assembly protein LptD [Alphaproteobacteria bacterium]|nr:LPS assembly protein LptD [Alphaproteobacteria bacterium]
MVAYSSIVHRLVVLACFTLSGIGLSAVPALSQTQPAEPKTAQTINEDGLPILLKADEVTQDRELGVVVARGGVEIAQGDRVLLADTLSYNQNAKTVTASGNVQILEPDGQVIFADYVELSDDMRNGTIENLRILLTGNARIAAAGGRRTNGTTMEMARGVYSPCKVCKETPDAAPLWQIKADRVIHNKTEKSIDYYDASLEMFGVPVLYTPYMTHPDPTVKRKSGFLTPSFGTKTNTGLFLRTPYFWNIGPDVDITLDPILTEKQKAFMGGEYRQAFDTGEINLSGSFTYADQVIGSPTFIRKEDDVFRGHIFTDGRFDLNETYRAGWDINRSTDQTYLRKFNFWEDPGNSMTSKVYAEGFRGRNYMSAQALSFQDLCLGQRSDTPIILPLLDYNGVGEAGKYGGRWTLDANARGLTDGDDPDSQRFSLKAGYEKEFISDWGLVSTASGSLRGDLYNVDQTGATDGAGRTVDDGITGRIIPRVGLESRYPFARYSVGGRQVIEPMVALYAAPNGGNSQNIPNSDSTVFETDDVNVFSADRTPGLDRVETGQKAVAGINLSHYQDNGGRLALFVGQSYRFRSDYDLSVDTGVENDRSDWVGRLEITPNEYFSLFYRFNYAADEFEANRNELSFSAGGDGIRFSSNYTYIRDSLSPDSKSIEELSLNLSTQLTDNWTTQLGTLQDLRDGGGSLQHTAGLKYEDECFIFLGRYLRSYINSADIEQEDAFLFTLTYKTLGEVTF